MKVYVGPRSAAALFLVATVGVGVWHRASVPVGIVVLAAVLGLCYLTLAIGLSLLYRVTNVVNLALGVTANFGATVAVALLAYRVPWVIAALSGVCVAAVIGALTELVVLRRLEKAPGMFSVMATVALALALFPIGQSIREAALTAIDLIDPLPNEPPLIDAIAVGVYLVSPSEVLLIAASPVIVAVIGFLAFRTRIGLLIRSTADDRDLARLGGVRATSLAAAIWAFVSGFAALIALLGPFYSDLLFAGTTYRPVLGVDPSSQKVFVLLLWPLTIAAIGRGRDVIAMAIAAMALALLEQILIWNDLTFAWLVGVCVAVLLVSAASSGALLGRGDPPGAWQAVQLDLGWPEPFASMRSLRVFRLVCWFALGLAVAFLGASASPTTATSMGLWVGVAIVGLAIFVESGLAGRLTFAHLPIGAMGSAISIVMLRTTGALAAGYLVAIAAGIAVGVAFAFLDTRARGFVMATVTLLLALVARDLYSSAIGSTAADPTQPGVPLLGGRTFTPHQMLAVAAVIGVAGFSVVRNLQTSSIGRAVVAVRDNVAAARSFGVRARDVVLTAAAVSGGLAALGGAVAVQGLAEVNPDVFSLVVALTIVFAVVVGGLSGPTGAIVGTLVVIAAPLLGSGIPGLTRLINAGLGLSGLVVLLLFPQGVVALWQGARDRAVRWWLQRHPLIDHPSDRERGGALTSAVRHPMPKFVKRQQLVGLAGCGGTRRWPRRSGCRS